MNNIFEKHINETQRKLRKYNNMILKSKYDKFISDELIQTYIDARYYNYGVDTSIKLFYRRIYMALRNKAEELIELDKDKAKIVDAHLDLFQYYFYFDYVRKNPDMERIMEALVETRLFKLNLKSAIGDNFKKEFLEEVTKDMDEVNEEINLYSSNDFAANEKRISTSNYYRIRLDYFFEFPKIFSKEAIEEVYTTDVIGEDRLFVEYPMVCAKALSDVIDGNFSKIYICDFAVSLLEKKKKLEQLLSVVDNQSAQDKIYFEVTYEEFKDNKEEIFKLIKRGFKFTLRTNENMPKLTSEAIKIIEIFSCILVNKKDINQNSYKNQNKVLI